MMRVEGNGRDVGNWGVGQEVSRGRWLSKRQRFEGGVAGITWKVCKQLAFSDVLHLSSHFIA